MSEISQKQNNKELVKKEDKKSKIERVREGLADTDNNSVRFFDLEPKIEEFIDLEEKKGLATKEKERKQELVSELAIAYGLKNGFWVASLSYRRNQSFLDIARRDFIKEYDCKTSIELMLADRIIGSYWRSMRLDATLNRIIEKEDGGYTFDDLKVNIIRELSKGLESASRQLNANILLLKELKQPKLNVKVNTNTAFIGQNQQFNAGKPSETTKDEINDPE